MKINDHAYTEEVQKRGKMFHKRLLKQPEYLLSVHYISMSVHYLSIYLCPLDVYVWSLSVCLHYLSIFVLLCLSLPSLSVPDLSTYAHYVFIHLCVHYLSQSIHYLPTPVCSLSVYLPQSAHYLPTYLPQSAHYLRLSIYRYIQLEASMRFSQHFP